MNESDAVRERRLGVVAVFVENRLDTAPKVNQILSEYGRILVGRMGIPYHEPVQPRLVAGRVQSPLSDRVQARFSSDESRASPSNESGDSPRERNLSVIAVIVDGSNDEIGAMTGKLGAIPGVSVKAALRKKGGEGIEGSRDRVEDPQSKSEVRVQNAESNEARGERLEARAQNEDGT